MTHNVLCAFLLFKLPCLSVLLTIDIFFYDILLLSNFILLPFCTDAFYLFINLCYVCFIRKFYNACVKLHLALRINKYSKSTLTSKFCENHSLIINFELYIFVWSQKYILWRSYFVTWCHVDGLKYIEAMFWV